jgi:hypothetical protein
MANTQTYGPLALPSGKQIHFKEPVGGDKLEVLKYNPIGTDDAVSGNALIGMYLAAKCVTQVDGNAVNGDYKHLFDNWSQADSDFYTAVYSKMFAMDEKAVEKIDSVVDFLRKGLTSSGSSTSTTAAAAQ